MTIKNDNFHPIFDGIELGIGTWAWGDRLYWGYGSNYAAEDVKNAFVSSIENGLTFFDTAEVYGQGKSETLLGSFVKATDSKIIIATKVMPFPWRLTHKAFTSALNGSLARLNRTYIDLYQLHMPLPPLKIETWMEFMAEAYQNNLIRAVGVSNFSVEQMQRAYDTLIKSGVTLASNQVEYSLLDRGIEENGVLKTCQEMGIKCIGYSPIGMGLLSGKYSMNNPVKGMRASKYSKQDLIRINPLLDTLKKIGSDHGGMSASQVAINWVRAKAVLPIPGAKNHDQAVQNSSVLGWNLEEREIERLDDISKKVIKEK